MRTIRLGRTNLQVSEVGFGGIPIQRCTEEDAVAVVSHCLDAGVTFVDTAWAYTTSEERIGRAIRGRRKGLVLASKSPAREAKLFREQLETSLRRLDVDYIDLYQFHNVATIEEYEAVCAPGGPLDVAREAQAAGRIGHIGITSHSLDIALQAVPSGHFATLMFPFNFVTNEAAAELIPLCQRHDVAFISMKPMGGGLLENATLAFKYLRQFPYVLPLVGIEQSPEIDEIVAVMEGPAALTPDEQAAMQRLAQELGSQFCRRCGYCQPCPQEINIAMLMNWRSFAKRMPTDYIFGERGQEFIDRAETCLDCGACESRCPYHLPIREVIAEQIRWHYEQLAQRG